MFIKKIIFPKNFGNFKKYFSYKQKLNFLYKHIHPDILGPVCPLEFKTKNEKAVKELNLYVESLETGLKYDSINLEFFVKVEESKKDLQSQIKDNNLNLFPTYSKLNLQLDELKPNSKHNKLIKQTK